MIGALYSAAVTATGHTAIAAAPVMPRKIRQWAAGVQRSHQLLNQCPQHAHIWVHCASLGEYEQAAPLLEAIEQRFPEYRILLTFFSPSGYTKLRHHPRWMVHHLPLDTPRQMRRWVEFFRPDTAIFIKYEFWRNALHALHTAGVPTYLAAGVFRADQPYFRWARPFYRSVFHCFSGWCVQDAESAEVLRRYGYGPVTVTGDPRVDRVATWRPREEVIERLRRFFPGDELVVVAGSTYAPEEKMLAQTHAHFPHVRWLIAPHEINEPHIQRLLRWFPGSRRWSDDPHPTRTLILDTVGLLKDAYYIGHIAVVGGGFTHRIHNILEPAAAGIPVLFGPRHRDFPEARGLIQAGAAFVFALADELILRLRHLLAPPHYRIAGQQARQWINRHRGATDRIMNAIFGPPNPPD